MIERYESPIVKQIWNEQEKFNRWAQVEIAVCQEYYERGEISEEDMNLIRSAKFPTIEQVKEIEKETDHDVVAFIRAFCNNIEGNAGRHIHKGLTSSDVCDTAQALAMRDSLISLVTKLTSFALDCLLPLAIKYKNTPCVGRTHGVHAEVTSFGLRIAGWYAELSRGIARLLCVLDSIKHAKLSGAVGTYSQTDPEFEKSVLKSLGLSVEPISTQIVPRDRYAELISTLALVGGTFERMAIEIRSLQRTEIREVEEGFKKGQAGSSAMPHKRNPISSEKICGLVRLLRGNMLVSFENMALWHDRDISHSSTERIILPDSFHIVFHMISTMEKIFNNLQVFPENMMKNICLTKGLIFSQNVLGWFLRKGKTRTEAYSIVQTASKMVIEGGYERMIDALEDLCEDLTAQDVNELADLFNPEINLKYVDVILKRTFGEC